MYITNDLDEYCNATDPFGNVYKLTPGYRKTFFITPGFCVTVTFPDGSTRDFKGLSKEMYYRLSDYYDSSDAQQTRHYSNK